MRRRTLVIAGGVVGLALAVIGIRYLLWTRWHVSTDDAYVEGHVLQITPRIPGTVVGVPAADNALVEAGATLVQLDPTDYQVRLDQATAALARARQTIDQQIAAVEAAHAEERLAAAQLEQAGLDFTRVTNLRGQKVVPQEELDRTRTAFDVARARREAATRAREQAEATLGPEGKDRYDRPLVREAESVRTQAALDLSYATIAAPERGLVTRRAVEVGQRVQPGQPLLALVPLELYVIANFKETQLAQVRVGQPVRVEIDLYPGADFSGHVDSIAAGTGAAFSLLPPENATGNWVKVVQRVPVKVVLDRGPTDRPLRVGLSVVATIDVSDTSGALLGTAAAPAPPSARGQAPPGEPSSGMPGPRYSRSTGGIGTGAAERHRISRTPGTAPAITRACSA
jgi:membrane fusion protein (multidrug efflux system)